MPASRREWNSPALGSVTSVCWEPVGGFVIFGIASSRVLFGDSR